jgi:hypothetical protein
VTEYRLRARKAVENVHQALAFGMQIVITPKEVIVRALLHVHFQPHFSHLHMQRFYLLAYASITSTLTQGPTSAPLTD